MSIPRHLRWKLWTIFASLVFGGIILFPTLSSSTPEWWTRLTRTSLKLGLDLQGGMHLVLRVDLEKALENNLDFSTADLKERLAGMKINLVKAETDSAHRLLFILPNSAALEPVQKVLKDEFSNLETEVKAEAGSFPRLFVQLKKSEKDFIRKHAVNQSLEIIRNRIDQFGVAEPVILLQGDRDIVVQLPGVKDPERALKLVGQTAQLQFKMVAEGAGVDAASLVARAVARGAWKAGDDRKKLNQALRHELPAETEIYFEKKIDKTTKKEQRIPILLKQQVTMTGEMIKNAAVRHGGNFNEPYVSLDLTGRGGTVFGQVTSANVGKRFAIILDETVRSAPVIREKILGGHAQITGDFSYEEANDLAIVLRVGALPAPVSIVQNLTVGASLGQDSIDRGLMAGAVATLLVVSFMIIYYRLSGLIANVGLLLNIFFLFAGLAAFSATLTLPGIAGIILTIGMAVDANVLIYERMREEFFQGKELAFGVEGGYGKAFWTIIDSQVTTLITALALFLFGTGPIKGFAVTLSLGIVFNLFAAIFCTRIAFEWMIAAGKLHRLHFVQFVRATSFDFMKYRKIALLASALFAGIGIVAFVAILFGHANLGVDFSGGVLLQYRTTQAFNLDDARRAIAKAGVEDAVLQDVAGENRLIVRVKKDANSDATVARVSTALASGTLPAGKKFQMESRSEIGSSVSESLRNKAIIAIILSFVGVVLYLALRFNFSYGIAATITTFHDVFVVLGVCWITGIEINLLIVTALLTLAGYSLNDTVVIFDRIREIRERTPQENFIDIINQSLNETLARTIVTSLTVFLTVFSLFLLGGSVLRDFSFALLIGLVVGTYSTVFIACPLVTHWQKN